MDKNLLEHYNKSRFADRNKNNAKEEKSMNDINSLAHSKWNCKYNSSDTLFNSLCKLQGYKSFDVRPEESLSGNQRG